MKEENRIYCSYITTENNIWRLEKEYSRDGLTIPVGFKWDGASTPRFTWFLTPSWDCYAQAALIHDWYCEAKNADQDFYLSRKEIDQLFLKYMLEDGTQKWRAYLMYGAVRLYATVAGKK